MFRTSDPLAKHITVNFFFNEIIMLQMICSEHQTNAICVAKPERVL